MKSMDNIINKNIFLNAFSICRSYANSKTLNDINILLLKESFNKLNKKKLIDFYEKYIVSDKFYGNPIFFSSDIVNIPKGLNEYREYRFFDLYSMILYNAIGILFYKVCNDTIKQVNSKKDSIYSFTPTIFSDGKINDTSLYDKYYVPIKADKDYRNDYTNYIEALKTNITSNKCLIKIDLSKYFDSISHQKLINILEKYSCDSVITEYGIDKDLLEGLLFYFKSMMGKTVGIPQGRDNCFSDYFGELYLKQFDFDVKKLCESSKIKYNCMIRYVDDITILFDVNKTLSNKDHYKELSYIVQKNI